MDDQEDDVWTRLATIIGGNWQLGATTDGFRIDIHKDAYIRRSRFMPAAFEAPTPDETAAMTLAAVTTADRLIIIEGAMCAALDLLRAVEQLDQSNEPLISYITGLQIGWTDHLTEHGYRFTERSVTPTV